MIRAAILVTDNGRVLGKTTVSDKTFVIKHDDGFYFRTEEMKRLPGGGIGAVFLEQDPVVRNKLDPA